MCCRIELTYDNGSVHLSCTSDHVLNVWGRISYRNMCIDLECLQSACPTPELNLVQQLECSCIIKRTGAIDVSVVTCSGLILDVRRVDGNTTRFLLRSLVDLRIVDKLSSSSIRKNFCNRSCQSSLPMIDVPDGTNVQMRLCTRKLVVGVRASSTFWIWRSYKLALIIDDHKSAYRESISDEPKQNLPAAST